MLFPLPSFRARRVGNNWYCCELIDTQWIPRQKCVSEEEANLLALAAMAVDELFNPDVQLLEVA